MTDIDTLEQQAVNAAIAQKWEDAVIFNEKILDEDHSNIGATLRLGYAYLQQEKMKESRKYYQKALKLQPKNPVALENLERITILEESAGGKSPSIKIKANLDPNMFLEVPGKTKSVTLVNLGQKNHLAELDIGERVEIKLRKRKVEVRTLDGDYIGYLPDDVSKRMIYFMEADSTYSAYVKEANSTKVVLFVKEDTKGEKVAHYSSFPSKASVISAPKDSDEDEDGEEGEDAEDADDDWKAGTPEAEEEIKHDYQVERDEDDESEE
ncbi:MAG: tetratricopeptide repeat protein [Patescibacteria group bacterium]